MIRNLKSDRPAALLAQDIEDPTDFPKGAPSLRSLDAAVRCPICGEYFTAPVSLLCGHCFCSMCIRRVIAGSSKADCPSCRQNVTESQLRPCTNIEDMVTAWRLARGHVLLLAKKEDDPAASEPVKKKRKLDSTCVAGPSRSSSAESTSDTLSSSEPAENTLKPNDVVQCPLCQSNMPYRELEKHMDLGCPLPSKDSSSSSTQKSKWSELMGPKSKGKEKERPMSEEEHLPKRSYGQLKDHQLRQILGELDLNTVGAKALLAARLQHFTMLWNANIDRSPDKREPKSTLVKELNKWEKEQQNKPPKATVGKSHLKTHKIQFAELIAAARPKSSSLKRDVSAVASSPPTSDTVPLNSEQDIIVVDSDDEDTV
ncbi:Postreplication repair E3 ubiquitin-protein ligase rad18 [Favolaschia claudopus]|uniref:Postreplication repair E3 ubiquitin-protein ligase RAD18 n=1 Tax=Favolaschia claudopus TaxID=2862362 RepID=A0AAW0C9W6_9AGAR